MMEKRILSAIGIWVSVVFEVFCDSKSCNRLEPLEWLTAVRTGGEHTERFHPDVLATMATGAPFVLGYPISSATQATAKLSAITKPVNHRGENSAAAFINKAPRLPVGGRVGVSQYDNVSTYSVEVRGV
jgi:hypothetical protein